MQKLIEFFVILNIIEGRSTNLTLSESLNDSVNGGPYEVFFEVAKATRWFYVS